VNSIDFLSRTSIGHDSRSTRVYLHWQALSTYQFNTNSSDAKR